MGLFYPEHLDRICCCARLGFSSKPVFEDPDAAFAEATMDFQTGIAAIQEQFDLEPFTPSNWEPYKTYGAQIPTEDETLREECMQVSIFLDFYENSFPNT